MTNVREIAFEALLIIDKGEQSNSFLSDILDKYSFLEKVDRSFLARLVEGTTERMLTIDYILGQFSKVPVRKMKPPVRSLLRLGVYQIMYMDQVPESAAVNETVKIAKKRGLSNLSGFINGVLRNVARNADNIEYPSEKDDMVKYLSVFYSCPEWIVDMLLKEQGVDNARCVLENSVSTRPLSARVNLSKISREELVDILEEKYSESNLRAVSSELLPMCIQLENIDRLGAVEEFGKGYFTIQDLSSMLVCYLADIDKDDTVIDVCASPGGKTLHAADIAIDGTVISCDVSEDKLVRIRENIKRCGFDNISARCLDATKRCDELVGEADVLIADVPCSGIGVMGRKNDIKYRLRKEQISELSILQRRIIDNVADYVKPGGIMMYSTCTVNKTENEENAEYILSRGFKPVDFYDSLPNDLKCDSAHKGFIQLYGKNHISDGFFVSKFIKE